MRQRFDRTLRVVMWLDAFLSFLVAVLCMVASPAIAVVGLPHRIVAGVGTASVAAAIVLAACGAVTGVAIMVRLRAGIVDLPSDLRLPIPAGMRPRFAPIGQDHGGGRVR